MRFSGKLEREGLGDRVKNTHCVLVAQEQSKKAIEMLERLKSDWT